MEGKGVLTETAGRSAVERELVSEDRDDYTHGEGGEGGGGVCTEWAEAYWRGTPGVVEHQHARDKGMGGGTYTDAAGCSAVEGEDRDEIAPVPTTMSCHSHHMGPRVQPKEQHVHRVPRCREAVRVASVTCVSAGKERGKGGGGRRGAHHRSQGGRASTSVQGREGEGGFLHGDDEAGGHNCCE